MFVCIILFLATSCAAVEADVDQNSNNVARTGRCCRDVGCFYRDKASKFDHFPNDPKCVDEQKIALYLSTPESTTAQEIVFANLTDSVDQLQISRNRYFYVIIHGFNNKFPRAEFDHIRTLLIIKGHNVMLVDWSDGAKSIADPNSNRLMYSLTRLSDYKSAIANARVVAAVIARVLDSIIAQRGLLSRKIHIVGHSLGAHLAAFVGARVGNIGTITGLDPAHLFFASHSPAARLDETDAFFVQVIHTSDDMAKGTDKRMGDIDFYVNGGDQQPGCDKDDACNHERAVNYYAQSIINTLYACQCRMVAFPCKTATDWRSGKCDISYDKRDYAYVGYHAFRNRRGRFYLDTLGDNTTSASGYCGTQVKVTLKAVSENSLGTIELAFDIGDPSLEKEYWKFVNDVEANTEISVLKMIPGKLNQLQSMHLRHGKGDWFDHEGFVLEELSIVDIMGTRKSMRAPVNISSSAFKNNNAIIVLD